MPRSARPPDDPIAWKLQLLEHLASGHARRVREAVHVSQVALAGRLQASEASVIRWERGDFVPRDSRVVVRWLAFLAEAEAALSRAGVRPDDLAPTREQADAAASAPTTVPGGDRDPSA